MRSRHFAFTIRVIFAIYPHRALSTSNSQTASDSRFHSSYSCCILEFSCLYGHSYHIIYLYSMAANVRSAFPFNLYSTTQQMQQHMVINPSAATLLLVSDFDSDIRSSQLLLNAGSRSIVSFEATARHTGRMCVCLRHLLFTRRYASESPRTIELLPQREHLWPTEEHFAGMSIYFSHQAQPAARLFLPYLIVVACPPREIRATCLKLQW